VIRLLNVSVQDIIIS